ncbi:MAG: alpha/beta hydrolase [Betaproteobacteria bacterium]|nr:alpha/beta hydrolase [Betaproteobacteria bacterium]
MRLFLLALLTLAPNFAADAAPADVGVVLLHGKWGSPASMEPLARALESRGYSASTPEMAWSGQRLYDIDYPSALKEIEALVRQLRAKGAKRVVVGGQSLGANAAMAYAASGMDLDGLVILAPGHFPERGMGGASLRTSLDRARQMVAANRGNEAEFFNDINQGKPRSIRISARAYMSYFDPDGLGAMTKNIRKLPKTLPLLLAIGTQDPFFGESKTIFDAAPAHTESRYVALQGDHFAIPNLVATEFLKWIEAFAR